MLEVRYYVAADGRQPFAEWFAELEPITRTKIARAIARMEQANLSNVKSVGSGVLEYRIDVGPGYRLYFGRDGEMIVILLTGGSKKRQRRDIEAAVAFWEDYNGALAAAAKEKTYAEIEEIQRTGPASGQGGQEIRRSAFA
jgi:putative addiction module killer protein